MEPGTPSLAAWSAFYTITGSSAAALIGLMFVVITLVTSQRRERVETGISSGGIRVFSTPTVVHFGAALLVSAALVAPWHSLTGPACVVGITGVVGLMYVLRAITGTRHMQGTYEPDAEDWLWYSIAPLVAYVALIAAAILFSPMTSVASFINAATILFLILVGIRNSWDVVTYIAVPRDGEG